MNTRYFLTSLFATLIILAGCSEQPPSGQSLLPAEDKPTSQPQPPQILVDAGAKKEQLAEEEKIADTIAPAKVKRRAIKPMRSTYIAAMAPSPEPAFQTGDREPYATIDDNKVMLTRESPVSTLSVDVDTGSYSVVRRYINGGRLPPKNSVRTEELINYFNYHYPRPESRKQPIQLYTEVAPTPWNSNTKLLHVGAQGFLPQKRPAANLVFLLDVSGSMHSANKLPLLKASFKLLVNNLPAADRVSIVTYARNAGVGLKPTAGEPKSKILSALERLNAGGSTHGSAGIREAYRLAEQAQIDNGINRVILATDGDFNVGVVSHDKLIELIEKKRAKGISLTTLGFGSGNYNDKLMEQLADKGNGNYGYIDTISEAQKVLVDELASTLETIAADVKIQIEFNPAVVAEYRLIGYENRLLNREDFNNDKVDAGEIGAGHTVTALYEITLVDADNHRIDPLRYGPPTKNEMASNSNELAFLKLRYKLPNQKQSTLMQQPINRDGINNEPSQRFRFSTAVAAFGQLLRGGNHTGDLTHQSIIELANNARGEDHFGYRSEFVRMVRLAASLKGS